jgi:hypothetical protein
MAATRNQTQIDGALYELSARGVMDGYFTKDDKESVHPFQWTYDRWPASLPEDRWDVPINDARWGQRCEFEFNLPGDVLTEASLEITLPSWLPPEMTPYNTSRPTYVEGASGNKTYYGYVNGIAYFLFEKIQIFQDKILLQEVSGDSLYVANLNKGSWNQGFLTQKLAGVHDGSYRSIQDNATPGSLKLTLPMIGCGWPGDRGLPLCGLRNQTFRLRLWLRPLEQLVESVTTTSGGVIIPPTQPSEYRISPWEQTFTQEIDGGADITGVAPPRSVMKQPNIILKTKQLYLLNEARDQLAKETIEIPYIRYFDNLFSINQLDYAPIDRGGTANIVKFLDANYTVERIMTYFRNTTSIFRNRLWDFENSAPTTPVTDPEGGALNKGQFYNSIQLTIAGQLREGPWDSDVWQQVMTDAKEERSLSRNICEMNWARGWRIDDEPPAAREPSGGINFTTADRPMLTVGLNDIVRDPTLGYKQAQMVSCCESWALYRIRNGRGGLEYAN